MTLDREAARRGAQIQLGGVTKAYRSGSAASILALDEVTMQIASGEAIALTGPSGSGKSTLLHLIGGMDQPDRGTITVDDFDVGGADEPARVRYRRQVGFVFQRFHLLPTLTAQDNVLAPILPFKVNFDKQNRARELLEQVGLAGRENALPSQLSGGQQQRVAIARSLMASPRLLLADEPTGSLDSDTGRQIMDLLLQIRREYGPTLVIATHDPQVAERCARRIRLVDGKICARE